MRRPLYLIIVLLVVIAAGCGTPRVYRLTDESFQRTPAEQEVKLYVNQIRRPHVKIAHVQSFADPANDKETKRKQLQELKETARKLGADAVMNVQQLNQEVRGMVQDERTPFPSLRQGTTERYFLRGTAIRYIQDDDSEGLAESAAEAEATIEAARANEQIPTVTSGEEMEDDDTEILPRGLGPIFR